MRRIVTLTTALALTLAATPVHGQFYLGGYASFPTGDFADVAETGWMVEGGVRLYEGAGERLAFYVGGAYGKNEGDTGLFDVDYTSILGLGHVVYGITTERRVTPYVIGSIGYWSLKEDVDALSEDTNGGLALGGGFGVGFAERFWIETRFLTASIEDATASMVVLGAGASF